MKKIINYLRNRPHVAIGLPAILCAFTFGVNLASALSDGIIDGNELHQLLSTADAVESVILFIVIAVLKNKDK